MGLPVYKANSSYKPQVSCDLAGLGAMLGSVTEEQLHDVLDALNKLVISNPGKSLRVYTETDACEPDPTSCFDVF